MIDEPQEMVLVRGFDPTVVVNERLYAESALPYLIELAAIHMEWTMSDNAVIVHGVVRAEWFCVYYSYGAN